MWIQNFLKTLTSASTRRQPTRRRPSPSRLRFEPLEDRRLLAFDLAVDYGSELAAQSIMAADFNGDGRADLATLDNANYTVRVMLVNGDGTFQPPRTSGTGIGPKAIVAGDLNGDGKADLVTVNARDLSLLLSNGDGTFQAPQSIVLPAQLPPGWTGPDYLVQYVNWNGSDPLAQYAAASAVGDMNGDGTLDIVAAGSAGYQTVTYPWLSEPEYQWHVYNYANVLLGNGDGTFSPAVVNHLAGGSPGLYPGDFNNDGRLDIVLNGGASLGNGDGTLQDFVPSDVRVVDVPNPVGDFNGDGNLDVLSDNQGGPTLWAGNGDGTFQRGQDLEGTGHWHSTVAGDVNADGKLDVVVIENQFESSYDQDGYLYVSATARVARVLLSHGNGSFATATSDLGTVPGLTVFESLVLADFDGDGFPDLGAVERFYEDPYGYGQESVYRGVHVALNDGDWTVPPPPPPSITLGDVTVTEGNAGTRATTFIVTLSAAYSQPVTVDYATANGTAAVGSDYQAASGTLTIPAGQKTGTITVLVSGDRLGEPNETFVVNLVSPTNATIADGQGVGTIVDDEPRISISDVTKSEGKKGQTTLFSFTVTLSSAYDQPVNVSFRTVNGTATTGNSDYVAKTGTLTFAPGETTKTITIEVKGDSKREANETFYLDLFGNSGNSQFTKNRGLGTILNDD